MKAEELRVEAAKCRRLAGAIADPAVEAALRQMAGECEAKADEMEAAAGRTLEAALDA